uniref:Putative secreted protein n=1 Tax=Ixodes ricinus TaxID=34613 RepID=A0A6B0URM3_IXORI
MFELLSLVFCLVPFLFSFLKLAEAVLLLVWRLEVVDADAQAFLEHELASLHFRANALGQLALFQRLALEQFILPAQVQPLHLLQLLFMPDEHLVPLQEEAVLELLLGQLVLLVQVPLLQLPQRRLPCS